MSGGRSTTLCLVIVVLFLWIRVFLLFKSMLNIHDHNLGSVFFPGLLQFDPIFDLVEVVLTSARRQLHLVLNLFNHCLNGLGVLLSFCAIRCLSLVEIAAGRPRVVPTLRGLGSLGCIGAAARRCAGVVANV